MYWIVPNTNWKKQQLPFCFHPFLCKIGNKNFDFFWFRKSNWNKKKTKKGWEQKRCFFLHCSKFLSKLQFARETNKRSCSFVHLLWWRVVPLSDHNRRYLAHQTIKPLQNHSYLLLDITTPIHNIHSSLTHTIYFSLSLSHTHTHFLRTTHFFSHTHTFSITHALFYLTLLNTLSLSLEISPTHIQNPHTQAKGANKMKPMQKFETFLYCSHLLRFIFRTMFL